MSLKQRLIKVGASLIIVLLAVAAVMLIVAPHAAQAQDGTPPRRSAAPDSPAGYINVYVDTGSDTGASACVDGTPNDCSLRGAINKANADPSNFYNIYFTPTVTLIALLNPLPTINTALSPYIVGNSGVPRIDAIFMANGDVFSINDNDVKIADVTIVNGTPTGIGVYADIHILTGTRNLIDSNYIGTLRPADVYGGATSCTPNPGGGSLVSRNSGYGVWVDAGASGTSGASQGAAYLYGNTIGCHDLHGVVVNGPDYVYIGEDASGYTGTNYIGVNASSVPLTNTFDGIDLLPNGSNASNNDVVDHNQIVYNGRYGIYLHGNGTANTSGAYNTVIRRNNISYNGWDNIFVDNKAYYDIIGGPNPGDGNTIGSAGTAGGGSHGNGIYVLDSVGIGILGNTIGYNSYSGVRIDGGNNNWVGGAVYGIFPIPKSNSSHDNAGDGVQLVNATHDNLVSGNTIQSNGLSGVAIFGGAHDNSIGSTSYAITDTNYIQYNTGYGVFIADSNTTTNTLGYNYIAYNSGDNVTIQNNAHANVIDYGNAIAYGTHSGIYIANAYDNHIGWNVIDYNSFYGVILDGANAYGTLITGTAIYNNGYDGIGERNSAGLNVWSHVSIYDNGGLGIDKNAYNDALNIVDPPTSVITSVVKSGGSTTIKGTGLAATLIDLYKVAPDPSGFGEGKTFVGEVAVSSGKWTIVDATGGQCYTLVELPLGIAASEFGANSCRTFLPLALKNH